MNSQWVISWLATDYCRWSMGNRWVIDRPQNFQSLITHQYRRMAANDIYIIGQIERITTVTIFYSSLRKRCASTIWLENFLNISCETSCYVFVCNLDCGNDTKLAKKLFLSKKYIMLDSHQFIQKILVTVSADGILPLNDKMLQLKDTANDLNAQQKKLKEEAKREKRMTKSNACR